MLIFLATLLATLSAILRSRAALGLENLALLWSAKTPFNSFSAPCNAVRRKHRQKIVDDQAAIPSS